DPVGTSRVSYFSARGKQLASIEGLGSATINAGAGNQTMYAYDNLDRIQSMVLPEGNRITYSYDLFHNAWASNVSAVQRWPKPGSPLSIETQSFNYDPVWNKVTSATNRVPSIINPKIVLTTFAYDDRGNLVRVVADAGDASHVNATSRFEYDGQGRAVLA